MHGKVVFLCIGPIRYQGFSKGPNSGIPTGHQPTGTTGQPRCMVPRPPAVPDAPVVLIAVGYDMLCIPSNRKATNSITTRQCPKPQP